ncbi:UDP-glucose 4-epimerase GalE [Candidatus Avelusimicrobium fimicolum]|uniref:UDP-glucose 4-epimerase GalE n=1 Tax=Candidatus Avelusimicrobium fimicolum TaxID=3416216 RepID=UPI002A8D2872|nr:UDP-glucose 4-epimerase GalE [Spirochaetia bacterium]MDY3910774.1 UDP-glucose 4-epimerase GalE [Elusimicrobiaceae bacterium]
MKNILVIGGAGYIGSHMVRMLAKQGYNPVVFDNLSKGHREAVANYPFELGDLGDKARLTEVFKKYGIEAVMHFAAFAEVGESVKEPSKYYHNNVAKVLDLLDALVENDIKYFVFSSTAATFGEPVRPKIDESHPQNPINPYGNTKLMVEKILADFDTAYGLKATALRYFNASGADDSGEIGESHNPETHLIPIVLQAAAGKRASIKMFGTDYPTPDGTCVRDYVHVNDLARAHILALEKMFKDNVSERFNLGSGNGFSVAEIVKEAKRITGIDFTVEKAPRRDGDPAVLVADSAKAERILGWKPQYNLTRIIETAWNWEQHRKY